MGSLKEIYSCFIFLLLNLAQLTSGSDHELIGWSGESYHAPPRTAKFVERPESAIDRGQIQIVSMSDPRAILVKGFLSDEECQHLIDKSRPTLQRSGVVDVETGKGVESEARTSSGTFFARGSDEVVRRIEGRIAEITHIPTGFAEGLQVLRYDLGQQYREHYDYFFHEQADHNGGNRIATALLYLNTPEEGGETVFPMSKHRVKGAGSFSECGQKGLGVKAVKGDMLVFWSLSTTGELDMYSKHAGCPVVKGEKWTATKWMHVGSFQDAAMNGGSTVLTRKYTPPAPPVTETCFDKNPKFCPGWKSSGECDINPGYMHNECAWSCRVCT